MSIFTIKQKKDLIVSIFGEGPVSSNGKDIAVHCPICRKSPKIKKKKKLSIAIETGVYHCWVCEAKGKNIARFVQINYPNYKDLEKIRDYFNIKSKKEEAQELDKRVFLPQDFRLVATSNSKQSLYISKYLRNRGLEKNDLLKYKAGYSFENAFKNRVVFPSFDKDLNLNFYVTRTCDPNIQFLKYKNCGASKKDIIFNEYLIEWDRPIILVEGIFDAIKAGDNAVPILGSWIDKNYLLFQRIVEKRASVILCLDPDAKDKEMKIAKNLFQHGIEVKLLQNKEQDLGDMNKKDVKNLISNAKHFDNMQRMRYLISGIKSGSVY